MNYASKPTKTKEMYQRDLNMSRMNLLLSVIFTVVNLVMVMCSVTTSFFFSASIPYYPSLFFAINCGIFDTSYYEAFYETYENGLYADTWQQEITFLDPSIFWAVFAISILMIVGLLLLWFFSKKYKVCSMITLAFYIVDTLFLLGFSFFLGSAGIELILQLLFHEWIVYYALLSVRAWKGMDTAPPAAEMAARAGYSQASYGNNPYIGSPYGRTYGGYDDEDEEEEESEEVEEETDSDEADEKKIDEE